MHKRLLFISTSLLVLALAAGCGGGGESGTAVPPPPEAGGAPAGGGAFDMSKATGTVAGKISFEGAAPPNEKPQMSSDPYCAQNASKYPTLETVIVSDGGLENVIVYVNSGLPAGATFATPAAAIEINQENCHYIPHAFTMMTNQTLKVKNSDGTLHNIHVWSEKNPVFNTAQPRKDMVSETKFAAEETIPIRCDVHRWMSAFVGIFSHPFHTVSKQGGTFELKLPPGNYEIVAWHEKFGKKSTTMVEVKDSAKTEVSFSFNANDKAAD